MLSGSKNGHILLLLLLFFCCKNESNPSQKEGLPNTPETVSKQWQSYLDQNKLDKASSLSTAATKAWLAENKEIFLNDSQVYHTLFISFNCEIDHDHATCLYTIKEEGELINDYFILKKVNGQWLVDLEEDSTSPELEEQIFKEMEKELKLDR